MDSVFFQSVLVQPPEILGRPLRDMSAYHALMLLQFDSPFIPQTVTENNEVEIHHEDIIFFLYVCGTEFDERDKIINVHKDVGDIYEWGKEVGIYDGRETVAAIKQYLKNYLDFPHVYKMEECNGKKIGGKGSMIPWPFKMVGTVMMFCRGMSESELWNMPINRLAGYRACIAEENGYELENERLTQKIKDIEEDENNG